MLNIKNKIKLQFSLEPNECYEKIENLDNFNKELYTHQMVDNFTISNSKNFNQVYKYKKKLCKFLRVFEVKKSIIPGDTNIILNDQFIAALRGVAFSCNSNKVFKNETKNFIQKNGFYKYAYNNLRKFKKAIFVGSSHNFGHWLYNHLSRLCLLDKKYNNYPIIIGEKTSKRFIETLKYFDIKDIIFAKEGEIILIDELIVPEMPWHSENGYLVFAPNICNYLRLRFRINDNNKLTRKLYQTRKNTKWRRIINEDEVIDLLETNGYEVFDPSDYSIDEQIQIAQTVKTLICPFGAGSNFSLFMDKNAEVIELKPPLDRMDANIHFIKSTGIKYQQLIGKPSNFNDLLDTDYSLKLDELKTLI